ncbi:hypothetical protein BDM02DRAFT_3133078 [Thelephora ganbajun]|uniref:Uncharacterized protein n=1 Tax=Thelephora ganbajun TaxID=370292 RepID=A0ACB6YYB5_THEGA|nr:hypothetical protein BDM02DRAFT_3133078 [Thelephora ganbajun]
MEVNLTDEDEDVSPPGIGNMSTTDLSQVQIRVETPEDEELEWEVREMPAVEEVEEEVTGWLVPIEEEVPEPVGIQLPRGMFNWQDKVAQGCEAYYRQQREEEERAQENEEFVPPPGYEELFPEVVAAD